MNKFHDYIYKDLANEFPFQLMEESKVINNEKFIAFRDEFSKGFVAKVGKLHKLIAYEGYTGYPALTKKRVFQLSEMFPEADAFMVVDVRFTIGAKTMINGSGAAGGKAAAKIWMYHKSGKRVMALGAQGMSKKTVKVVAEQIVSDRKEIPEALTEGSEDLYVEMKEKLPKKIKKMKKKLAKIKS